MREFSQSFLAYMLGRERLSRAQAEENVELQETYEKLDEENKSYCDRGKSGLLERLRKSRESADKSLPKGSSLFCARMAEDRAVRN
jgi:hypothetical protein